MRRAKQYNIIPHKEWVSMDGKALKNTVENYSNSEQNFISVVSALSHQRRLVMGVKVMENKNQSEIEIVQELLDILDLKGVVFTFDALHCQKKTLDIIVESGNEYVVKVKKNQPKLYQTIEKFAREQKPLKTYTDKEKTRDRQSERIVTVFSVPPLIDPKWPNLGCVIKVERQGMRGQQSYDRIGYYISSLPPSSTVLAAGIRGHWLIENSLHWVKDVIYQEDKSPQKAGFAPINLSLLKTWVLTLLRCHGFESLTDSIATLSHNLKYMLSLCT